MEDIFAFPRSWEHFQERQKGMTLRDWFAGQALVGLLSRPQVINSPDPCELAYDYADDMLERKKEIESK